MLPTRAERAPVRACAGLHEVRRERILPLERHLHLPDVKTRAHGAKQIVVAKQERADVLRSLVAQGGIRDLGSCAGEPTGSRHK